MPTARAMARCCAPAAIFRPPDATTPPVLITAYDGDPLQAHIDRLGDMPAGWDAQRVPTPQAHQDASLAFLKEHVAHSLHADLAEDTDEGWLTLDSGLIHWRGTVGGDLLLHAPAAEAGDAPEGCVVIDAPGHGLSDDFDDIGAAIEQAAEMLGADSIGTPASPAGDPALLYPDLTPDRYGLHLLRAWSAARAEAIFAPWYAADADHAIPVDAAALAPAAIARRARARLRAGDAAARYHAYLEGLKADDRYCQGNAAARPSRGRVGRHLHLLQRG